MVRAGGRPEGAPLGLLGELGLVHEVGAGEAGEILGKVVHLAVAKDGGGARSQNLGAVRSDDPSGQ